jgi:hypothetical protein
VGIETATEVRYFLELRKDGTENHTEMISRAFGLGERLAEESGTKFILMLDEFPEILKVENGSQIVKMFRTMHEGQRRTSLVISGSEKRTLEAVALGEASPFYKQLIPIKVSPFSYEETLEFMARYGLSLKEDESRRLYDITAGMPFYLQFIGRSVVIDKDIDGAIAEFISEEGNLFFREEYDGLSEKEKGIVRAMASGASSPSGIAGASGEPVTSVSSYLISLQDKGVVEKTEKATYMLQDRVFSLWLRERFAS